MKQIHELIADYAAETPHKTALQDPYGEISYEELEAKSTATSCKLTGLGVKQGNAVAVYVPFVKEIMLGAIAAFRTGCIFVPFDGAYPEKRLEYMLEDAEAAAILTTREFWESKKLYFPEDRVLFLDEVEPTHETSNLKPQTSQRVLPPCCSIPPAQRASLKVCYIATVCCYILPTVPSCIPMQR